MGTLWMVRAEGGSLYEDFREEGVAAVGWSQLAEHAKPGVARSHLREVFLQANPGTRPGAAVSAASQVWRFVNEVQVGDRVLTYSPDNRTYLVGTVTGEAVYRPDWTERGMALARSVAWEPTEVERDRLGTATRNSLGSTLTVFQVPAHASNEVLAVLKGESAPEQPAEDVSAEVDADPLADIEVQAVERVKDRVSELDWDEMQQLVAGILRAMGYKTQVSPAGPDRGKDIIASPDGFGFEHPRIVVEVKHRQGQMGSQAMRSFLGGRHAQDRGLYVSTGGFTRDAWYEADRAAIPLALWTLDHVVRALMEHYEATDAETKRIVPLKRVYWPA